MNAHASAAPAAPPAVLTARHPGVSSPRPNARGREPVLGREIVRSQRRSRIAKGVLGLVFLVLLGRHGCSGSGHEVGARRARAARARHGRSPRPQRGKCIRGSGDVDRERGLGAEHRREPVPEGLEHRAEHDARIERADQEAEDDQEIGRLDTDRPTGEPGVEGRAHAIDRGDVHRMAGREPVREREEPTRPARGSRGGTRLRRAVARPRGSRARRRRDPDQPTGARSRGAPLRARTPDR
jgi:hypothetical protein